MIRGRDHVEWPRAIYVIPCYDEREDYDEAMWEWILWGRDNQMLLRKCSGEDYFYDTAYDKEAEMEWPENQYEEEVVMVIKDIMLGAAYEEAMWEEILGQGPPKDDDIEWVKGNTYDLAFALGRDHLEMNIDQIAEARERIWGL